MYKDYDRELERRVRDLERAVIDEGLFDKLFNRDKESFDVKDVISKLPSALSFGNKKSKMNWKLDKDGKPIITSSLVIPLTNKPGNFIQLVTVLSLGLKKKIFSLKQRITQSINNKQTLKEDFPLWENESFKSFKDLLTKVKDSLMDSTTGKINDLLKKAGIKESFCILEDEDDGVIRKVGNKWKILKKNRKDYWDADYKTKADAEAALRAYWANKRECRKHNHKLLKLEDFTHGDGRDLLKNVQHYLIKIFGPTLYFDHDTDTSVDLFYKGSLVAELLYNNKTSEIVIMPDNQDIAPVAFYDTSEYEIQDYLSDLIIGDIK